MRVASSVMNEQISATYAQEPFPLMHVTGECIHMKLDGKSDIFDFIDISKTEAALERSTVSR